MISTLGETVTLYEKGLYARNSVSSAVQAIAQDMVTLILIVSGMIAALLMIRKERMIGKFLLTGLFGYMLYTYMSYAFLMYYNDIFLLYANFQNNYSNCLINFRASPKRCSKTIEFESIALDFQSLYLGTMRAWFRPWFLSYASIFI